MAPRNVLFIDIDGVLHRSPGPGDLTIAMASLDELWEERVDLFEWAARLSDALGDDECDLLVHSSWRAFVSADVLRERLGPLRRRFRGCTARSLTREASVLDAVAARRLDAGSYRVLDDEPGEFESIRGQVIVCSPGIGVSDALVAQQLRAWLDGTAGLG